MHRFLCIHLPYLATDLATCSSAGSGSGSSGPILLTREHGTSVIVAHASPVAVAAGARPGMLLAEARALCPEAAVLPHDARRDTLTLEHLALWAQRFSPVVRSEPPDALLGDVGGCARLFRGEENIARQAVRGLAEQRIRARAAIADTVSAAWALAHAGDEAVIVAPPGQDVACVAGLPPAALRLGARVVEQLDLIGIRTIGDLLMLPANTLPSRFGEETVLRIRQLLGEAAEWVDAPRRAAVFAARMAFGPSDSVEVLMAAIERVVATLCERLVAGGAAARRLRMVVYFEQRPPEEMWIGLSRPSRDARHLRSLAATRAERVDVSAGACGLMVLASETAAWWPAQAELFDGAGRSNDEGVASLLDRLANHLGAEAVVRAEGVEDHQPERAYRYVAVVGTKAVATATKLRHEGTKAGAVKDGLWDRVHDLTGSPPGARPLVIFARPELVRVMALVPDGPPTWMSYRGQEHVIAGAAGPERIETGWWRGGDARRDYFRVLTEGGQQFWMYRELESGGWFIAGSYE